MGVFYVFHTYKDSRQFMYDELLKDGWRYNNEGEIKHLIGKSRLLKQFESDNDIKKYFESKYPRLKHGCTCDECFGDYHYEKWSLILHGQMLKN